jgi:multicomponent K+:H+ antiporter subunit A
VRLPIVGELHVGSATFFDVGVFCLVLSSVLLILVALAHQSVRSHRQPASGPLEPEPVSLQEVV